MNPRQTTLLFTLTVVLCVALGATAHAQPVQGYVDLHSHLMAEHSYGGGWFWGTVEGPIESAVRRCDGNFPFMTHAATRFPVISEILGADTGWHLGKRRGYDERRCRRFLGIKIPGTCPQEHFEDWPRWDAKAHQQMWQGWLRQAHEGGLRIMVVSLAESNFLCINTAAVTRRYDCDEMASVRRQAVRAREFATRNSSWVGIATTPAQARALIQQGKLALVLAVEVTQLFPSGDFVAQLDELRALGVRSVQVTHHANNRFGGAAPIPELVKNSKRIEKIWGGGFQFDITDIDEVICRDSMGNSGDCDGATYLNERGLTAEGKALVQAMMARGMLVDVAHLSRKSFAHTYQLAKQRGYYPLFYSHAHMWDTIDDDEERHEKFIQRNEFHMITSTGGMVGLRTGKERTIQYAGPTPIPNSCQGSARSFAQSLMYAVDNGLTVGLGADLNGFIEQIKPRFHYPLPPPEESVCLNDYLQIIRAGGPTEFQKKGLAHVGLLPQMMSDLRTVGVPAPYLDHLNRSAENFLRMWERSEILGTGPAPGANLALQAGTSASSTFCWGTGVHCYSSTRVNDGDRSTTLGGLSSWANDGGTPMPQWLELTWSSPITVSRVELYTTAGFEVRDYDIQYWTSSGWTSVVDPALPGLPTVTGNTSVSRTHNVSPQVTTSRLRVLGYQGPTSQPGYVRINEIEVY